MPPTPVLLPLYVSTLGLSALLLFWVQPLFARLILPLLGGAPAVWITAMLFFQAALLAGYLYAHVSVRWLGPKRQSLLHGVVLASAFAALPVALPQGWTPPAGAMPAAWQLTLMAAGIGLPFFALSATAPLLQRWFAHTGHAESANPYFLYSASNVGSIAALLGYPLLIEPSLGLTEQGIYWTAAYGALVLLIALCGMLMWRRFVAEAPRALGEELALSPDISWRRRLHWIGLAFVPSSLMLGVTLHISTDIAAVPLLWIMPLTLYLLSFVIVFARRPLLPHRGMLRLQVPALILVAVLLPQDIGNPLASVGLHLGAFFVFAMACHGELAERRPAAERVTEFYLWLAVGGVLGGIFNGLLAPHLFNAVVEYPLMLAAAALLRPWRAATDRRALALDVGLPLFVALLVLAGARLADAGGGAITGTSAVALAVAATAWFGYRGRPLRFALGIAILLAAAPMLTDEGRRAGPLQRETLVKIRSFFGVNRVELQTQPVAAHLLIHGTTVHGGQRLDPAHRARPLTYFHEDGPLGQLFRRMAPDRFRRVGVIGLGAGAAACYARPGQDWVFFEIDPVVERIARDARYFTYLADCAPDARVVIGDARLSLRNVADGSLDLLILDAFTSDAIPVHLLTREAFALYERKLSRQGIVMAHISNEFLDLEPVLGRITAANGLFGVIQYYGAADPADMAALRFPSVWVVAARLPGHIVELAPDMRWQPLRGRRAPLWTDDYVNIVRALRLFDSDG